VHQVFVGTYADAAVAVKKLFQQRPKEQLLLDFRSELARISQLAHENLAPFVRVDAFVFARSR
jgi:hypothetical protein